MTPFEPDLVLDKPLVAMLATVGPEGPRIAPVWFAWEAGELAMLGDAGSSSVKRIGADPRVSVEIVDYDNAAGRMRHLGMRGTARVTAMDVDLFRRLLRRYLGEPKEWNQWFITRVARIDDPDGRLIRLRPDSVFTNDVSFFRTGPELLP